MAWVKGFIFSKERLAYKLYMEFEDLGIKVYWYEGWQREFNGIFVELDEILKNGINAVLPDVLTELNQQSSS